MKHILSLLTVLLLPPLAALQAATAPLTKPNIVFFLVDDMGWQETSVPFHSEVTELNRRYRTPNMERLAAQGMKFTQAYASAVCSPTRVSALTGMNVARHRVTNWTLRKDRSPDNAHKTLQPPEWNLNGICANVGIARTMQVTPLPALLRTAGYRTIHVGKAHFGAKDTPGENPLNLGFDVNIAGHAAGGPGSYWGEKNFSAEWRSKGERIWDVPGLEAYHGKNIFLTEALTLEAIKAVEKAVADKQPFYLYLSHYAIHAPWEKDDRFYQKYLDAGLEPFEATLASMIEGMDKSLGDLMAALDRLGIAENTVILFMSDNGSPSQCPRNLPLRGHKLTPYEGGIREPMLVKWPGVTKPASVCRDPVVIEDFFPTILELAGAVWRGKTVQTVDGVSFAPLLRSESQTPANRAFIWHFPHNYSGQGPFSAIRRGPWKLIYHHAYRHLELFNIDADISESRDLAKENPAKAAELAKLLGERLRDENAQMPTDKATGKPIEWPDQVIFGSSPPTATKPNVILIMTDDQGYGEIAAHGNPIIKTPHMDRLHSDSVRLNDFHVDPTCSPTRSALLTGRYSTRTGVWHTINGRSMMPPDELTLAEVFKANGYATAMIGKWHLGDNYPCRPEDQGFDHTVWHQGGGVDNAPDYWGNDYFDDTYKVNGAWQKFEGYCTDVWFREAIKYIEQHRTNRFFLYLTPNAPHGPYYVPDRYAAPYEAAGMPKTLAKFYGMIANIDENLGRFRARLAELGLAANTLLIFLTDNGTTAGWIDQQAGFKYFNAGMRGWKGSAWDGGHRVPCFWHWPVGGLSGGRDVKTLTAHIDILPTLVDLIGLEKLSGRPIDGISLRSALLGHNDSPPDRTLFVHVQRAFLPPKWTNSAVMTQRWRLLDGEDLYDIVADPGQQTNVAAQHPEILRRLRGDYEHWWTSLEPARKQTVRYVLGGLENPMIVSSHDWLMPGVEQTAWHQNQVKSGALVNGAWAVDVKQAGTYEITLYRWPPYLNQAMDATAARVSIQDVNESKPVDSTATSVTFRVRLKQGPTMLHTWLTRSSGKQHGAYYTRIRFENGSAEARPDKAK